MSRQLYDSNMQLPQLTEWYSAVSGLGSSSETLSLIDRISDTRSQGYTDLQSLVTCLDHRGIVLVLDTVCSQAKVVLGCAMH